MPSSFPDIQFTDIQRLEIMDCLPRDSPNRENFVLALEHDLRFHKSSSDSCDSDMDEIIEGRFPELPYSEKVRKKLVKMIDAYAEMEKAWGEWTHQPSFVRYRELTGKTSSHFGDEKLEVIQAIARLAESWKRNAPRKKGDQRKKNVERGIIEITLAAWCRCFPGNPLPKYAKQGRTPLDGTSREDTRATRLCIIVIEAVTGKTPNNIARLYETVTREFQTGVPDPPVSALTYLLHSAK
ncbi:MAG: hypothetical protein ACYDAM_10930 [Leptospirales bacterium]